MSKPTPRLAVARGLAFIISLKLFWHYLKLPILQFLQSATNLVPLPQGHLMPDRSIIVSDLIDTSAATIIAYILIATERRYAGTGLPSFPRLARRTNLSGGRSRPLWFAYGAALGLAAVSLLMLALYGFAAEIISFASITSWSWLADFLKLIVVFTVVGVSEELWFRGYAQRAITDGAGFWTASIMTSAWCMWVHYTNGDPLIGAAHAGLDGVRWCLMLRLNGNLAFAIGFHSTWDFTQSAIFGVPDSTIMYRGHLGLSLPKGPEWMTGGIVGPEAVSSRSYCWQP